MSNDSFPPLINGKELEEWKTVREKRGLGKFKIMKGHVPKLGLVDRVVVCIPTGEIFPLTYQKRE